MSITRRKFLKIAGSMGGATLFAGCHLFDKSGPIPKYIQGAPAVDPTETLEGVENLYTVCGLCPGNCGIRCRVAQGTVVKIDGNPYHPIATETPLPFDTPLKKALLHNGSVCAIGSSGIQSVYNPFRVIRPLKRVGQRGSGKWKGISWEQAFSEIVNGGDLFGEGKLEGLKALKGLGKGPTILAGDIDWGSLTFLKRFASAFPGAKIQRDGPVLLNENARLAAEAVFGPGTGPVAPDYKNARFVMSFGDAPLDSGVPLVSIARDIANARVNGIGFKWAVADPRLSTSASKADVWIPVIPGKDLELALGIMHVLAQNYSDKVQFPDEGLRTAVMSRSIDEYARECGLDKELIHSCARYLVQEKNRSVVVPGRGVLAQSNGLETAKVILTLNRMVGSMPGTGGLTFRDDTYLLQAEKALLDSPKANKHPELFGEATSALLLWEADPVYDVPTSAVSYFQNREKVPLFIAIDREITETSALADYILPDTTYLERWDICISPPAVSSPGIGIRVPVIGGFDEKTQRYNPVFSQAKVMEDIIYDMTAPLNLPGFEKSPSGRIRKAWDYYEQALSIVLISMKEAGIPVGITKSDVARAVKRGGIFVKRTAEAITHNKANKKAAYHEPNLNSLKNKSPSKHDLQVITYTLPFHRSPRSGLNRWLLEVLPKNRLLINTEDAHKSEIENLAPVVLESSDKKTHIDCTAQVVPGIRPGVVALAKGFGYSQSGASAIIIDGRKIDPDHTRGKGANPANIPKEVAQIVKSSHKT